MKNIVNDLEEKLEELEPNEASWLFLLFTFWHTGKIYLALVISYALK